MRCLAETLGARGFPVALQALRISQFFKVGSFFAVGFFVVKACPCGYKGEFQLADKRYCYPLIVTDHASRYLLLCEAMESNREDFAFMAFERLFQGKGLPQAIRFDNCVPFASPKGLFNLSRLSVWWLRWGISIERIKPGHPQHNLGNDSFSIRGVLRRRRQRGKRPIELPDQVPEPLRRVFGNRLFALSIGA